MKIAFIDTAVDGHHLPYIKHLIDNFGENATAILPEKTDELNCVQRIYSKIDMKKKNIIDFYRWTKEVAQIIQEVDPDLVHVLTADPYLRYFGIGLKSLKKRYPLIITLHWLRKGKLKLFSRKMMACQCNKIVVHSAYLLEQLRNEGINNGVCIDYPCFTKNLQTAVNAKENLGMDLNIPVISAIGGTREDKGLDILLDALSMINAPFQLLVAGNVEQYDEPFIMNRAKKYRDKIHLHLHYLTDEEFENVVAASDIIALPYRKIFNGASGPLVEGVHLGKCIIGSSHGNLGDTIRRNHLGYTFTTENTFDLACKLEKALTTKFLMDKRYREFQKRINPQRFTRKYLKIYSECI